MPRRQFGIHLPASETTPAPSKHSINTFHKIKATAKPDTEAQNDSSQQLNTSGNTPPQFLRMAKSHILYPSKGMVKC